MTTADPPRNVQERRSDPRIVIDLPVVLRTGGHSCGGRTRDASARGLLVELHEPLSFIAHQVEVELTTTDGGTLSLEADVVRRALSTEGTVLIALRLVPASAARAFRRRAGTRPLRDYSKRVQPSRAKPRTPRPLPEARNELRAVGARALELAFLEPEAGAPPSFIRWVRRLAEELGSTGPPASTTNRALVHTIARLHRESGIA